MGLFAQFEAGLLAATLMGDPVMAIALVSAIHLVVWTRHIGDWVYSVFCGALCATLCARTFGYETKSQSLTRNALEAFTVVLPVYFLSKELYILFACLFCLVVLERYMVVYLLVVCTAWMPIFLSSDMSEITELYVVVTITCVMCLGAFLMYLMKRMRAV